MRHGVISHVCPPCSEDRALRRPNAPSSGVGEKSTLSDKTATLGTFWPPGRRRRGLIEGRLTARFTHISQLLHNFEMTRF